MREERSDGKCTENARKKSGLHARGSIAVARSYAPGHTRPREKPQFREFREAIKKAEADAETKSIALDLAAQEAQEGPFLILARGIGLTARKGHPRQRREGATAAGEENLTKLDIREERSPSHRSYLFGDSLPEGSSSSW